MEGNGLGCADGNQGSNWGGGGHTKENKPEDQRRFVLGKRGRVALRIKRKVLCQTTKGARGSVKWTLPL